MNRRVYQTTKITRVHAEATLADGRVYDVWVEVETNNPRLTRRQMLAQLRAKLQPEYDSPIVDLQLVSENAPEGGAS